MTHCERAWFVLSAEMASTCRALAVLILHPCFLILVVLALLLSTGCEDFRHRAVLDSLVREGAREGVVVERLGAEPTVYERGAPTWDRLESFLARESASDFRPLRRAVEKYPRILYYTTAWRMTWVFLDDNGVVQGYYVTAQ